MIRCHLQFSYSVWSPYKCKHDNVEALKNVDKKAVKDIISTKKFILW